MTRKLIGRIRTNITLPEGMYKRVLRLSPLAQGGTSRVIEEALRFYLPLCESIYRNENRTDADDIILALIRPEVLGKALVHSAKELAKEQGGINDGK